MPASLVLGTAGHIDHGKTALIRALTGVDTDRLPEEKRRGITIELGFAPLELGGELRVGVVDVPGHEGLVRTMVAGATGIDLVLLVVAADEGVMPQTREHLAICELLGLRRGVVALTKCDAAAEDVRSLAAAEVEELLSGSGLAGAAIVPVSALTGEGVEALRAALLTVATQATPATARSGPARLCVDRVFAARGFGCVVTGTLVGGALAVGDAVELHPSGRRARVRGLQHFGESVERAQPGARCAVNLQGLEVADVARGFVVATPDSLAPTHTLDAELHWLPGGPAVEGVASVEFLVGTSERHARLAPIGADRLEAGARGLARLHLEGDPLAVLPGDRFVVRGFARTEGGGSTLGGGRILDVAPPHRRRSDPALCVELESLARDDPAAGVRARVARAGFGGIARADLVRQTGLDAARLSELLTDPDAGLVAAGGDVWLAADSVHALEERLIAALEAHHRRSPLRPGMPRSALGGALPRNAAEGILDALLARLAAAGRVVVEEKLVRLAGFVAMLTPEQEAMAAYIRADAMTTGLEPAPVKEWADSLGSTPEALGDLLAHLERDGSLVRAPGDLWFDRGAVDELRERLVAHLRENGSIDTASYKGLIGTTRKYAVPLMELFDTEHLTVRRGDARVLRRSQSPY